MGVFFLAKKTFCILSVPSLSKDLFLTVELKKKNNINLRSPVLFRS